jgi:hypothetical protein
MLSQGETLLHPWETPEEFVASTHAFFEVPDDQDFPSESGLAARPVNGGSIVRFVFWSHVVENQKLVIPLLEGSDILAFEEHQYAAGGVKNVSHRQELSASAKDVDLMISALISGSCDTQTERRFKKRNIPIQSLLTKSVEERQDFVKRLCRADFYAEVLASRVGKTQKIESLDLGIKESNQYEKLIALEDQAKQDFNLAIGVGADWETITGSCIKLINAENNTRHYRETHSTKQIEKLIRQNPGKVIAVLYGGAHLMLTRMVGTTMPGVSMQRFNTRDSHVSDLKNITELGWGVDAAARSGYFDNNRLNMYIAVEIAIRTGDKKTENNLFNMDFEALSIAAEELRIMWQQPLDPSLPEGKPQFDARLKEIKTIFGAQKMQRNILGFARRKTKE